jgi:hypothetical protein
VARRTDRAGQRVSCRSPASCASAGLREQIYANRLARFSGESPVMVPVVDEDPLAPSALPTADSW